MPLRAVGVTRSVAAAGSQFTLMIERFEVGQGARVAVVGPSGCGKSTLLALVALALRPDAGDALELDGTTVTGFREKPAGDGGLINGGFFVADPSVLDLVDGPETVWEQSPLETLARDGELAGFRHDGFWQPMDTLRDKIHLEELWQAGAPWKKW